MFVNSVPLGNASLDTAVQALKGAAQGTVLIGVSKPLPVTESQMTENTSEEDSSNDNTEVRSAVSDMHTDPASGRVDRNDSISRYECSLGCMCESLILVRRVYFEYSILIGWSVFSGWKTSLNNLRLRKLLDP